jgi:hypothetical protein
MSALAERRSICCEYIMGVVAPISMGLTGEPIKPIAPGYKRYSLRRRSSTFG